MALRCGRPDEGDKIVFGPRRECTHYPPVEEPELPEEMG